MWTRLLAHPSRILRKQERLLSHRSVSVIPLPGISSNGAAPCKLLFKHPFSRKQFSTGKDKANVDTKNPISALTPQADDSSNEGRDKKEEEEKGTWTAVGVLTLLAAYYIFFYEDDTDEFVTEENCKAKLEADTMPGTVPGCDRIQRVKMQKRIPIHLLTSIGIGHAKLEGTLWNCNLKSDVSQPNAKSNKTCWHRQKYWNDEAAYQLTPEAVEMLRDATEELHAMCLEAVGAVVASDDLMTLFEIPPNMREAVRESWRRRETDFLGRFDLMWDGRGSPKLAEYNADTPTILVETGRGQQLWFDYVTPTKSDWQFNNIETSMLDGWKLIASPKEKIHLAGPCSSVEEKEHLLYLQDTAAKVNIDATVIDIKDVGISSDGHLFSQTEKAKYDLGLTNSTDTDKETSASKSKSNEDIEASYRIQKLFKLYPYEWLSHEELGKSLFEDKKMPHEKNTSTRVVEPAWKLVLGNKAILALLWSMYPDHPNLLPAYFELTPEQFQECDYVAKPKYGREGQGIVYSRNFRQKETSTDSGNSNTGSSDALQTIPYGSYDYAKKYAQKFGVYEFLVKAEQSIYVSDGSGNSDGSVYLGYPIFQKHFDTARFSNRHIVIGSWMIGGVPAGINFREDSTDTTQDDSCFVPHFIRGTKKAIFNSTGAESITGTKFTDHQRQLYKELYGMEIGKHSFFASSTSTSSSSHTRYTGGGGGGGGSFWRFNRSSDQSTSGSNGGGSTSTSTAGSGTNGTGTTSTAAGKGDPNDPATKRAAEHQKAAETFRQKSVHISPKARSSSMNVKATGASHSTMSRAGMGGRG